MKTNKEEWFSIKAWQIYAVVLGIPIIGTIILHLTGYYIDWMVSIGELFILACLVFLVLHTRKEVGEKMDRKILLVVVIAITLLTLIGTAQAALPVTPHYIIAGNVYDDGGNLTENIEVTLLNVRTNEAQTLITNAKGVYIDDCANFKHGFENNDTLNVSCIYGSLDIVVDMRCVGIQADINRPENVSKNASENVPEDREVNPILPGMILVSAAGGLYYYYSKRKKRTEKTDK